MKPHDDSKIGNKEKIIRRVNYSEHVVPDRNPGELCLSTKLFSLSSYGSHGISVDMEKLILEDGKDPIKFVTNEKYIGSVYLFVGEVRKLDFMVGLDKTDENPYHGEIWSKTPEKKLQRSRKRELLKISNWYKKIEDVKIPRD